MKDIRTTIDIGTEGISWPIITKDQTTNNDCDCGCNSDCPILIII